tara:strand:+ start:139 stop:519 length:381 start_codon:yes stop_codon:yes gene_type:complete
MGYIYLLYNEEGYGYIGQTVNIKRRIKDHKSKNQNTNSKQLGKFKCEILEECDNDYLMDYEQYYYDMYNDMFPNMLVNKYRPNQTFKEYCIKNYKKRIEYRENRKEQKKIYNKQYYLSIKNKSIDI